MPPMRACSSGALLIALGLLTGCGGQAPSAPSRLPSTPSGPGTATTQSIVAATVSQAAMQTAMTVSPDGLSRTVTVPCADGGSMSMTFTSTTGAVPSGTFTSSSRIEFTECRTQTVTMNGDPALLIDGTYTFSPATGSPPSSVTATTRITGGLRFDAAGTAGRARYDCTLAISMQIGNGTPGQQTITSSGTIT
jgi:hypothetical protein